MIEFKDWQIARSGELPVRQYDGNAWLLEVRGVPEGYTWRMLVQAGEWMDVIPLSPVEGGVGALLTEQNLALSGFYRLQLAGTDGTATRHTNVLTVFVPESLSPDAHWPELPEAFRRLEAEFLELNAHPPLPGDDGCWQLWSLESHSYQPSDFPMRAGLDGHTPVRGQDYWTAEDVQAIQDYIDQQLGVVENGAY